MPRNSVTRLLITAFLVAAGGFGVSAVKAQENSIPQNIPNQAPSQAVSLNLSDLKITQFIHQAASGAYDLEKFAQNLPPNTQLLGTIDEDGLQAIALVRKEGAQKIALIAIAGTGLSIPDFKADAALARELLINAAPGFDTAQSSFARPGNFHGAFDKQVNHAIKFIEDMRARTTAPLVLTGHSLGAAIANMMSGKFGTPAVSFETPAIPATALLRFEIKDVGHPASVHFRRSSDLITIAWPNSARIQGRDVGLDLHLLPRFHIAGMPPAVFPDLFVSQHLLSLMENTVTKHPDYAGFIRNLDPKQQAQPDSVSPQYPSSPPAQSNKAQAPAATIADPLLSVKDSLPLRADDNSQDSSVPSSPTKTGDKSSGESTSDASKPNPKPEDKTKDTSSPPNPTAPNDKSGGGGAAKTGSTNSQAQEGDLSFIDKKTGTQESQGPIGTQEVTGDKKSGNKPETTQAQPQSNGGHYTEDQWYAKQMARISAFEAMVHEINSDPNIRTFNRPDGRPAEGQEDDAAIRRLLRARAEQIKNTVPNPSVYPWPDDFKDQSSASSEITNHPITESIEPAVDPCRGCPDKPLPPKLVVPPKDQVSQEGKGATTSPLPGRSSPPIEVSRQPSSPSQPFYFERSYSIPSAEAIADREPALYCTFDFVRLRHHLGVSEKAFALFKYHEQFRSTYESWKSQLFAKPLTVQLYDGRNMGIDFVRSELDMDRDKRLLTIVEASSNAAFGRDDLNSSVIKMMYPQQTLVALNGFIADWRVINLMPDYEKLGEGLVQAIKKAATKNIVLLLPPEQIPGPANIMLDTLRARLGSSIREIELKPGSLESNSFEKNVSMQSGRGSGTYVYVRSAGVTSFASGDYIQERLNGEMRNDTFISVSSDGFIVHNASGTVPMGAEAGLDYWAPAASFLAHNLLSEQSVSSLPIKVMSAETHPAIYYHVNKRHPDARIQLCVY